MAKKQQSDLVKEWSAEAARVLVGRTVTAAAYVPDPNWGHALGITLDNGTMIYVSSDDEGNEPGALQCAEPGDKNTTLPRLS